VLLTIVANRHYHQIKRCWESSSSRRDLPGNLRLIRPIGLTMLNDARRSSRRIFKIIQLLYRITALPDAREDTLLWLVAIRGSVALGLLGILFAVLLIPNIALPSVVSLMLLTGAFILANAVFNTVLPRNPSPNVLQWMRRLLIVLDVLVAIIAIYLSGGRSLRCLLYTHSPSPCQSFSSTRGACTGLQGLPSSCTRCWPFSKAIASSPT
jgi:hypothetical protein